VKEKETRHQIAFQQLGVKVLHGKSERLCDKSTAIENENQAGYYENKKNDNCYPCFPDFLCACFCTSTIAFHANFLCLV
jgi:hypothetical protein